MTAAFRARSKDAPDDMSDKRALFADVYADLEEWGLVEKDPTNARMSAASRIRSALKQFTELVSDVLSSPGGISHSRIFRGMHTQHSMTLSLGGLFPTLAPIR